MNHNREIEHYSRLNGLNQLLKLSTVACQIDYRFTFHLHLQYKSSDTTLISHTVPTHQTAVIKHYINYLQPNAQHNK
jgi:hypothetical protein